MRLPAAKIKPAILHPDEEVRLTAVSYFSESHSDDPQIMPLVIQAIEKYGRSSAFRILRNAERLPQSPATLDWVINELRRDFDTSDIDQDNIRFALGMIVLSAPVELLAHRQAEIDALPAFPTELRVPLADRLTLATWNSDQCWNAFEDFGRRNMKKRIFHLYDQIQATLLIEAVARFPEDREEIVLDVIQHTFVGKSKRLMQSLEREMIYLAGEMRLETAIPVLIWQLSSPDLNLADAASTALMRIGSDAVVEAIADEWWDASDEFRSGAADVLEKIHTDLCEETCLDCLEGEEEFVTAFALAHALLSHFSFDGLQPVLGFFDIKQDEWSNDHNDLKFHLVAAATVMEAEFPQYDMWYQEALENNWGWGNYNHPRIAERFQHDPGVPSVTANIPSKKKASKRTKSPSKRASGDDVREVLSLIVGMTDEFCRNHLNQEYAGVSRKLAEALARKRPSPLLRGKPNVWASAIVRTVGWVNFLHDKTQSPYMRLSDVDAVFGISESSGAAKMAAIRKMLKITPMNYEWTLPSRMADNPLIWMLQVNGLMMDVRDAPREVQEIAFEKGLIPFIPADRDVGED
jgi:hypothetical protein